MGHCDIEANKDSNTKLTEKAIESNLKEKVKNNTYNNIKHIVLGHGKKLDEKGGVSPQPQKNKINIGL